MKTDPQIIHQYLESARYYAQVLMGNAIYIKEELPPMTMSDDLREKLNVFCSELVNTKHDLFHEIFEIDELMTSSGESPEIAQRVARMQQWMMMSCNSFIESVDEVQKAVKESTAEFLVQMLLMSCSINILNLVPTAPTFEEQVESDTTDEDEDIDNYDPNCYAFYCEDSYPIGQLITAIRSLAKRTELTAETLDSLKVFLFAMQRLPLITNEVRMSLALRLDQGGESDWIEVRMGDGEFSLCRGTWIDGDADTESIFEVTSDYRDGDAFMASQFAESFAECARDVCREIVIDDTSDEPFTAWDLKSDKSRWSELPYSFD
jgi:hypothetical protein